MNDDPVIPLPPGRGVDIPARFIRQAYEYLQHTGDRYITFIFAGELVDHIRERGVAIRRHYAYSEDEIVQYFRGLYLGRENALNRIRRTVLHGGKAAGARIRFSEYP